MFDERTAGLVVQPTAEGVVTVQAVSGKGIIEDHRAAGLIVQAGTQAGVGRRGAVGRIAGKVIIWDDRAAGFVVQATAQDAGVARDLGAPDHRARLIAMLSVQITGRKALRVRVSGTSCGSDGRNRPPGSSRRRPDSRSSNRAVWLTCRDDDARVGAAYRRLS